MKLIITRTEEIKRPSSTGWEYDYETSREEYEADGIAIEYQPWNNKSTWIHIYKDKEITMSIEFDAKHEDYIIIQ